MTFLATKQPVHDRGRAPDSFLAELVTWGKGADESIFAPSPNPADIYALIVGHLGPWESPLHRRAAMIEVMRVHAGFESSWHWNEGVDITNKTSQAHIEGQETGIFQCSFDSTYLGHGAMKPYAEEHGIGTVEKFLVEMKCNHALALDYYARLVRVNIQWAGPLKRREILPSLHRPAMDEFMQLLA